MERKQDIETRVNNTLESVRSIKPVDAPAFFTEKTVSKLRASKKSDYTFTYTGLLKIAAVIVLLIINVYTIQFILGSSKQDNVAENTTATVKDLVNDYQPNDSSELTFEERLSK